MLAFVSLKISIRFRFPCYICLFFCARAIRYKLLDVKYIVP